MVWLVLPDTKSVHSDTKSACHLAGTGNHLPYGRVHQAMDVASLRVHRRDKDEIFRGHHSPLRSGARSAFEGLVYYDPDPGFVYRLEIEQATSEAITVETSDGDERIHKRVGTVTFDVGSVAASLTLYDTGHPGLFLPFRDATSGNETYGAGRYLDLELELELNDDGTVTIDFNLAYNPLCAYNKAYSCPLAPVENWLSVPIRAGERAYVS